MCPFNFSMSDKDFLVMCKFMVYTQTYLLSEDPNEKTTFTIKKTGIPSSATFSQDTCKKSGVRGEVHGARA